MSIIEEIKRRLAVAIKAIRLGFPLESKNRYLYCLGSMSLEHQRWEDWKAFAKDNKLGDQVWPLYEKNGHIASYQLVRYYRGQGYSAFGDYAPFDSGYHGDLKILRIDRIPVGYRLKAAEEDLP